MNTASKILHMEITIKGSDFSFPVGNKNRDVRRGMDSGYSLRGLIGLRRTLTRLYKPKMFTIAYSGTDCDGFSTSNNYPQAFYSEKVAQFYANSYNEASDGIVASAISTDELTDPNKWDIQPKDYFYHPIS